MNYFVALCAVSFVFITPVLTVAGLLTLVGLSGPASVIAGSAIVIGALFVRAISK